MLRAGLVVVLLAAASCSVRNPFFSVDDDDPIETEGPGPTTATQGVTSEPTSEPGTATDVPDPTTGTGAVTSAPDPVCGDGVMEGSEPCDDGNEEQTDACLKGCILPTCGDGFVRAGHETCDDGNDVDADDCTNACTSVTCGNGVTDGEGEQCDDGNADDTDECTSKCMLPTCGDGFLHEDEECDDGNDIDTDECTTVCVGAVCGDGHLQPGETCDAGPDNPQVCPNCQPPPPPSCGDGVIAGGEECDPKAGPYMAVGVPLCNDSCKLTGCFRLRNTPEPQFDEDPTYWLHGCAWADGKPVVVVTLLDDANQVVYMARGTRDGDWWTDNMTSGNIAHSSEYDVNLHQRLVILDRLVPGDGKADVLMVTSMKATPGNDMAPCYRRLSDGYGIAVYPNTPPPLPAQKPKMLVMGMYGTSGAKRFEHFDHADEISYDELGMDVCVHTKPFSGTFLLSLFP